MFNVSCADFCVSKFAKWSKVNWCGSLFPKVRLHKGQLALQRNPTSIPPQVPFLIGINKVSGSFIYLNFGFVSLILVNFQYQKSKIVRTLEKYRKTLGFISVSRCLFVCLFVKYVQLPFYSVSIESVLEGICVISVHLLYIWWFIVKDGPVSDEDVEELAGQRRTVIKT